MSAAHTPAWRVEFYWYSSIVGHMIGWRRQSDAKGEKTFRSESAAHAYAERKTGIPSLLVPYMSRKGVVVLTTRPRDWRDRLADFFKATTAIEPNSVGTPQGVNQK